MWLVILQANQSWREARRGMGDATPSRNHWHNELITLYRRFDASSSFEINHKVRESSSEESWITSLTSIPWGAYSYGLVLRASLKVMPTLSSLLGFIRISWSRVGGLWAKARMTADLVDWVGWNVLRLIKSGRRLEVDLRGRWQKAAVLSKITQFFVLSRNKDATNNTCWVSFCSPSPSPLLAKCVLN